MCLKKGENFVKPGFSGTAEEAEENPKEAEKQEKGLRGGAG
jgi:hypothetical protein